MANDFEAEVIKTIQYFSFFNYPPNFEEIYTFLKKKTSKKRLASILEKMTKKNSLTRKHVNSKIGFVYTTPQYSTFEKYKEKQRISKGKIKKIQTFLKILSWFPQIKLVGLSGTVGMMNAEEKDDIDLFIITARKRLWTARIIALIIAQILGLRRPASAKASAGKDSKDIKDKVCLNLFFDESNLTIPKNKQTEYVAHEVLQMKPLINKNFTYERFLKANSWVLKIFPNAEISKSKVKSQKSKIQVISQNFFGNVIENTLKKLQLTIIKQHQTSEIVTDTQLWFFPEDFGEKMPSHKS